MHRIIEQTTVHLPYRDRDTNPPVSIYLVHLSRFVRGQEPGRCHCQPHRKEAEAPSKPDAVRPLAELRRHALEAHGPCSREAQHRPRRSEEHTSELQSLTNLVCRLLLEQKKTHKF